ncbi:MAG: glycosyltransferase family 4 protein [Chloroflexota bacterium]
MRQHILMVGDKLSGLLKSESDIVHGGAELQHITIVRSLVLKGWWVDILSSGCEVSEQWDGGQKWQIPLPWTRLDHLYKIYKSFRASTAEYCLAVGASPYVFVYATLSRLTQKKFVLSIQHDWDLAPDRMRIKGWRWVLYLLSLKFASQIVVQHEQQYQYALQWTNRPICVLPNYLTFDIPISCLPPGKSFLWVGTYRNYKRPEIVLDLAERLPHEQFTLICKPTHSDSSTSTMNSYRRQAYESLVVRANSLPNVVFMPGCSHTDVRKYIQSCKALLITSEAEGWPNVLLEAATCGRATLSLNDVADQVITKNELGFVAETIDNMVQIIEQTTYLEWVRLGHNAHHYVRSQYSNTELTGRLIKILQSIS